MSNENGQNIQQSQNLIDEILVDGTDKRDLKINPPKTAIDDPVYFSNDYLFFLISDKGYIDSNYYNLWFNQYYHDFDSMSYISINDGTIYPLSEFQIVSILTNLTSLTNGNFDDGGIAEVILQHPEENIFVKIHVKLYSEEKFFLITYNIWGKNIAPFDAELFYYNDLDVDEDYEDDHGYFDITTSTIRAQDAVTGNTLGWTSPETVSAWDVGDPYDVYDNVTDDILYNSNESLGQDIGLATKYRKNSINPSEIWAVPIIYGFGTTDEEFFANTYQIKNEFINDFSVLDFIPDLSAQASVNATILNGGQNNQRRSISIYRNGTYLQSREISLSPGEIGYVNFENLALFPGEYNEITVSVNNSIDDYDPNDSITQTHLYPEKLIFNIKDLAGNSIEGIEMSLFLQDTSEFLFSVTSDQNGNATYFDLPYNDYELELKIPWINDVHLLNMSFTYPTIGNYFSIQTNYTTLMLNINDVAGNPVNNASIRFKNNISSDLIWSTTTGQNGNVTFQYLNGSYDIEISYFDYGSQLLLGTIEDFNLIEDTYYSHQVNLTTLALQILNLGSGDPLESAEVHINHSPTSNSFGINFGKEKTNSNGNVSIVWSSHLNYSIRVMLSGSYCTIDISGSGYEAMNFTNSPFIDYIFSEVKINLAGYEQFAPELTLFNSRPLSYIWNEKISIYFMLNVTNSNNINDLGPKWANHTDIIIRNSDNVIVYSGEAEFISDEIGNHSLILNTTSGYFTSGNPETYSMEITAQLDSYLDPVPIPLIFNIYNISTNLESYSSTSSLIWKENLTIVANYSTLINTPISTGIVTITWGDFLDGFPMQNLGNGIYSIIINTSIGNPGNYKLEIKANEVHHFSQKKTINLFVDEVPTTVNGTDLFDSRHTQYVTTQNLSFQYNFYDSYRNTSVPNESPSYQLFCDETEIVYSGYLIYVESSYYIFDPKTARFPIGTYHGIIEFSSINHETSFASIQLEIFPIPVLINDTSIPDIPYELYCYQPFILDFELKNDYDNRSITKTNATFLIQEYNTEEIYAGNLTELEDGLYQFKPYTETIPIGTYTTIITFEKANYTDVSSNFAFEILEIPTRINDTGISSLPYDLFIGESLEFDFLFKDTFRNTAILNGEITYSIELEGSSDEFSGNLTELGNGLYSFSPDMSSFTEGTYFTEIAFVKQNYTSYTLDLAFIIHKIPLSADFKGSSSKNSSILISGSEYTIAKGNEFAFDLRLFDIYNNSLSDCNISYILAKGDILFEGTLEIDEDGVCRGNFSDFPEVGLYSLTLTVQKTNYASEIIQIHLNIEYPTILGISQPFFIIGGLALLLMSVGIFGYVAVRRARIPRFIKDLNYLEKILSDPSKILPERYLSREQQLKGIYNNRWIDFDLEFPIKPLQDEFDAFISLYNESTNKLLLVDDAKKFLDDLTIYSSEEIVARLQADNVPEQNLPQLLEIIENYRKSMISEDFETRIISKVEEDEFDLDSLEPSSNENLGGNQ